MAEQSYYFEASPSKVFRALTDPRVLVDWFLSSAELEPRSGGRFDFVWFGGYHMQSKIARFRRNRSVAFEWIDSMPGGGSAKTLASFTVSKKGKGSLLALRHTGFRDPRHYAECSARWGYYLTNLKSVVDHGVDLRSHLDW